MEALGCPGAPKGGRVEKVAEKVGCGSFVGPPPGSPLQPKSTTNREEVVPRSTLENIMCKVLHKRTLGTPSNHEINSFASTKPLSSHSHLELRSNRELCPMGTLLDGLGGVGDYFGG